MKPMLECYNSSHAAFDRWNLTGFAARHQRLMQLHAQLPEALKPAFLYQLRYAGQEVAEIQSLVSPTGETNELYTQGRGVGVVLVDEHAPGCGTAVIAMLAALFAAGNSVILCCDDAGVRGIAETIIHSQLLPENLLQSVPKDSYLKLLPQAIRSFLFIGHAGKIAQLSRALAERTQPIISLVAETDLERLEHSKDPKLVLRFITEKVRSVNVTAIGGNAQLLALGGAG